MSEDLKQLIKEFNDGLKKLHNDIVIKPEYIRDLRVNLRNA